MWDNNSRPYVRNARITGAVVRTVFGVVLAGLSCVGEKPPHVPVMGGPRSGQPGDTLRFWARGIDPNGGSISFLFDFGDSTEQYWTAEIPSGDTFYRFHVYPETGIYAVRVRSRDRQRQESDWSVPWHVSIVLFGPYVAEKPQGPQLAYPDTTLDFSVLVGHILGESVSVQFDFGDTLGPWSDYVAAGSRVTGNHTYRHTGTFLVRARARDRKGFLSPWSAPDTVKVLSWPLAPPRSLSIRAAGGTGIRLRWLEGRNQDSVVYRLWFRPLGGEFQEVDSVRGTSVFHDPYGRTGCYTVSARWGTEEKFASETLSTLPVYSETTVLWELDADSFSGYGWNSTTGGARAVSMWDTAGVSLADVYFTDRKPGSAGPHFFLASAHLAPSESGGRVPPGGWRQSGLLFFYGNPHQPVPEYDPVFYSTQAEVTLPGGYIAVFTQDGYYALIDREEPDTVAGTIKVRSWFQRIRGLRLMQHEEP